MKNGYTWHSDRNRLPLMFASNMNIVPPGDDSWWTNPPFAAPCGRREEACFVTVLAQYVTCNDELVGSPWLGPAINGTIKLRHWVAECCERFDGALIGERSNPVNLGRRSSISGRIILEW